MKKYLIAAAALLCLGAGCTDSATSAVGAYEVRPTLMWVDENGKEAPVYMGEGKTVSIVVSPDQKHAAHVELENAKYVVYLVDLPVQAHDRKIAEQMIPEGSGGLDPMSITWIDDHTLQYQESGVSCGESGTPSVLNPGRLCGGAIVMTYRIDIETGAKTATDKWMETIRPLQL